MKTFYGRRFSRNSKKNNIEIFSSSSSFFNEGDGENKVENFSKKFKCINLEIGFGNGENLIYQAQKRPREGFVGCDPFLTGNIRVLKKISNNKIENVLITNMQFSQYISVNLRVKYNNIFILFPDPWPKKRHKKRRLVNKEFINDLTKLTKSYGKFFIKTDSQDYFKTIVSLFVKYGRFTMLRIFDNDLDIKPFKNTNYAKKASNNHRVVFAGVFKLIK